MFFVSTSLFMDFDRGGYTNFEPDTLDLLSLSTVTYPRVLLGSREVTDLWWLHPGNLCRQLLTFVSRNVTAIARNFTPLEVKTPFPFGFEYVVVNAYRKIPMNFRTLSRVF